MKKLIGIFSVLLLLAACGSNPSADLSSNDVIFEMDGKQVKQNELFTIMKASDAGNTALKLASKKLSESVEDSVIQKELDEMIKTQKDDLGDKFLTEVKALGFDSEEDYINNSLKPYLKSKHLIETMLNEEYTSFASEYIPREAKIVRLTDEAKANEATEQLKSGKSFDDIAEDYKDSTTYSGQSEIYFLQGSKLPTVVSEFITKQNAPATSEVLVTGKDDTQYFLVEVVEADATKLKDKAVERALGVSEITQKYIARIHKEHGFKVYDQSIYNALQEQYADYLAN